MGNLRILSEAEVESATGLAGKSVVLGPGPGPETEIWISRFMKNKTDCGIFPAVGGLEGLPQGREVRLAH